MKDTKESDMMNRYYLLKELVSKFNASRNNEVKGAMKSTSSASNAELRNCSSKEQYHIDVITMLLLE